MLRILGKILKWLQGGSLRLLIFACILLLIWGIVSPVGTLIWWLGESADTLGVKKYPRLQLPNPPITQIQPTANIDCYIVFLPGVGDFSADELTPGEEIFLDQLEKEHSSCVAVGDVFPYSANNKSLGGQRFLAPFWRFANQTDGWLSITNVFIRIRNLWRFAISADPRYGTVYNQGIANAIIERMDARYPIPRQKSDSLKILLMGTSGGVEVALGAVPYLKEWLNPELYIISIGGVFNNRKAFSYLEHFYHLRGEKDWVEDIGRVIFPARWPPIIKSEFNQARIEGRYNSYLIGPHTHDENTGYFGTDLIPNSDQSYVEKTLEVVNQLPVWELSQR